MVYTSIVMPGNYEEVIKRHREKHSKHETQAKAWLTSNRDIIIINVTIAILNISTYSM